MVIHMGCIYTTRLCTLKTHVCIPRSNRIHFPLKASLQLDYLTHVIGLDQHRCIQEYTHVALASCHIHTLTRTQPTVEYRTAGIFAGENFCELLKSQVFINKTFSNYGKLSHTHTHTDTANCKVSYNGNLCG